MSSLQETICQAVWDADHNKVLTPEKKDLLAEDLTEFVELSIKKYIRGQEEHGGNIEDRDLNIEMMQEIVDLHHYLRASMRKQG